MPTLGWMLLVKTYLGYSPLHGIGVFVEGPLPAGAVVWRFEPNVDRLIDPSVGDHAGYPETFREYLRRYSLPYPGSSATIFPGDNARFINHQDEPSLVFAVSDSEAEALVTIRDIESSDELTLQYPNNFHDWGDA